MFVDQIKIHAKAGDGGATVEIVLDATARADAAPRAKATHGVRRAEGAQIGKATFTGAVCFMVGTTIAVVTKNPIF